MSGHDLTYNSVSLLGILTTTLESVPQRDDSQTDTWYVETTIGVSCVANVQVFAAANQTLGIVGNRVQGATAADVCRNVIERLSEDRKPLRYRQDGVTIFESDGTTDANNGPKIVSINAKPMGANSIRIDFAVKIAKVGCSASPPPVIGNRFTVSDNIDDQHRTIRTWRGKLRLSNAIHEPHAFRELCVPVLSDGFKRERLHFQGELNALELSYEIIDRQLLGDAPPQPALKMSGTHTETLSRDGSKSVGEVYVRLDGEPGTDKQILLEQCMRVINSKVQADRFAVNSKSWIWQELILIDHFGEEVCAVEARARVQRGLNEEQADNGGSLRLGNMVLNTLGRPMDLGGDYSRYRTIPPPLFPCTTAGLFSAALQCPCSCDHQMPQAGATIEGTGEVTRGDEEPTQVTYDPTGAQFDIPSPGLSESHRDAMYMFANLEWHLDIDEGTLQLPLGDVQPADDATSAIVRLHAPTATATLKGAYERLGEWPTVPTRKRFSDPSGIVYTPLQYKTIRRPREYQGDGGVLHVVDVVAVFAMGRAPNDSEQFTPALPWDNLDPAAVPSDSFKPVFESK